MKMTEDKNIVLPDGWTSLRSLTAARIALGRTGVSLPLNEVLQFKLAHALARDAVFSKLDINMLQAHLSGLHLPSVMLQSEATDRHLYLQRPDLGRKLNEASRQQLSSVKNNSHDVCICLADGLSADAVNHHAIPVLEALCKALSKQKFHLAPVCIVEGGRVAIGDDIGSILQASVLIMLIGERPGLSSPHSLGAYLTYAPQAGLTDERRNCVSNIRPEGLSYEEAAVKILYLVGEMMRLRISGVEVKDNMDKGLPA